MALPEQSPVAQAEAHSNGSAASFTLKLWLSAAEQTARLAVMEAELRQMRNSRSWRLTAPLRAIAKVVMGDRGGALRPALQGRPSEPTREASPQVHHSSLPPAFKLAFEKQGQGKILVDVTALALEDLGAGVQRVTKRLLAELILSPPDSMGVLPVRLADDGSYWIAYPFLAQFLGLPRNAFGAEKRVVVAQGDAFLALDFIREHADVAHAAWRKLSGEGATIIVVAYDILPLQHPDWFPSIVPAQYARWLEMVSDCAHHVACISATTADAFIAELRARVQPLPPTGISVFPLGCDGFVGPSRQALPDKGPGVKRVLMVGTIEPRKGHAQALAAFEELWSQGDAVELVVAGRVGWGVTAFAHKLRTHPELGRRLHYLDNPDDAALADLYLTCDLLLMASQGEGFGLPIAEGGSQGMALLLRDLPIFREVAGDSARYFAGDGPEALLDALAAWRNSPAIRETTPQASWPTWADSAAQLAQLCLSTINARLTEGGNETALTESE